MYMYLKAQSISRRLQFLHKLGQICKGSKLDLL